MAYISFQPSDNFNTKLYTGDNTASQPQTGVGFQPDFVWIKAYESGSDWQAWNKFMRSDHNIQVVGDDLYVTNLERLKKGFLNNSSNAILIKLNQIGTVSETLDVIRFAQIIGYETIISHRSGDSEDTFISDLAVGTNSNQIKTGSLARSERVAKYNQLIRIEEDLGKKAKDAFKLIKKHFPKIGTDY